MIMMKTKRELEEQIQEIKFDRNMTYFVMGAIIVILIVVIFAIEDKLETLPPQNLGSSYYDGNGNGWMRFDLTDNDQVVLMKQIELVCKQNNMSNCMSALDVFGIQK